MFKDNRYINAGENEIYRYGAKAIEKVKACMVERNGYFSIPADGGKYWTLGTSTGKYGEFCKLTGTIFSVNKGGFAYAKVGTEKAEKFLAAMNAMVEKMNELNNERLGKEEYDD